MHALVLVCALNAPAQQPYVARGQARYQLELDYTIEIRPRLRRVEPVYEQPPPRMPYANGATTRLQYERSPNGTRLQYDNYRNGNGGCVGPNCAPPQPRVYGGYGGGCGPGGCPQPRGNLPPPGVRESYSRGPG